MIALNVLLNIITMLHFNYYMLLLCGKKKKKRPKGNQQPAPISVEIKTLEVISEKAKEDPKEKSNKSQKENTKEDNKKDMSVDEPRSKMKDDLKNRSTETKNDEDKNRSCDRNKSSGKKKESPMTKGDKKTDDKSADKKNDTKTKDKAKEITKTDEIFPEVQSKNETELREPEENQFVSSSKTKKATALVEPKPKKDVGKVIHKPGEDEERPSKCEDPKSKNTTMTVQSNVSLDKMKSATAQTSNGAMNYLKVNPPKLQWTAAGGSQKITLTNLFDERRAFKIKTSDNALFSVNHWQNSIERGKSCQITVTRKAGPIKNDKLTVIHLTMESPADDILELFNNPAAVFKFVDIPQS